MALVERHLHRPHFSVMPYKYTPPPISSSSSPSSGMATTATAIATVTTTQTGSTRSISQKRPRAQTLVLTVPTRPPPPSTPTTPHPSYPHSHPHHHLHHHHHHHPFFPQSPQPSPYAASASASTYSHIQPHSGPSSAHLHPIVTLPTQGSASSSSGSGSGPLSPSSLPSLPPPSLYQYQYQPSSSSVHVSEILPRLYISDLQTAEDPAALSALGITHVLSAIPGHVALPPALATQATQVPLHDAPFAELAGHLPRTTRYIARSLRSSPDACVLVHCAMGASRSVAVVCGYLIGAHGLHPSQALEFVRARRAAAAPNRGFVDQLHEYHRSLLSSGGNSPALD
ncbi:protein-tyrosine phosphatase-like protein [Multifurca ochricompacta]|uniref:protein-tyrosine-phosphatase n=1 Tax=Multifurca ochricompacta TaxID=376703 RepID=A0AAD4LZT5_9AGAM|nr:protein-tyrosine phosphatase-like protein [Multifurca ochricompacta]